MATLNHRIDMRLAQDELLPLADVRGRRLHCVEGRVWITLDHDCRDLFLSAGESIVVDRDGVTLLHALAPARLRVELCADPKSLAAVRGWRQVLARLGRLLRPASLAGA